MAGVTIYLKGFDELAAKLEAAGSVVGRHALGVGLYREALRIFAESQRLTPVDTGALRASGHVTEPDTAGADIEVEIGYGGSAAPYAIYVHEITSNYHAPPTQAKFLEKPVNDASATIAERLGADVEALLKI